MMNISLLTYNCDNSVQKNSGLPREWHVVTQGTEGIVAASSKADIRHGKQQNL